MAKIRINDLPQDMKIIEDEMKRVRGGTFNLNRFITMFYPLEMHEQELTSKVVEKSTSGIKQTMNTQV